MPLPIPNSGENKQDWDDRCMSNPIALKEFPDQKQRYGFCSTQWDRFKAGKLRLNSDGKIQHLQQLSAQLVMNEQNKGEWDQAFNDFSEWLKALAAARKPSEYVVKLPRSTLIVGDGIYNQKWHPAEEAQKAFGSMDRQPYIMDHNRDVEYEFGWMEMPLYDEQTKKLSAIPVVNLNTPKGKAALQHIQNRMLAGKPAETSVGFWAVESNEMISIDDAEEQDWVTVREWDFDHNALVTRGACSPEDGAGVGLQARNLTENNNLNMEESKMEKNGDEKSQENNQENNKETSPNTSVVKNSETKEVLSREAYRKIIHDEIEAAENARKQAEVDLQNKQKLGMLSEALNEDNIEEAKKIMDDLKAKGSDVSDEIQLSQAMARIGDLEKTLAQFSERTTRVRLGDETGAVQEDAETHQIRGKRTGIKLFNMNAQKQGWTISCNHTDEHNQEPPAPIQRLAQ